MLFFVVLLCALTFCAAQEECVKVISKEEWEGKRATKVNYIIIPVEYVFIHHTVTPFCSTQASCTEAVRGVQSYHMDELDWEDMGFSFMVGGDGNIYEGRGWHKAGAHTIGYNTRSIGIAFIGNYNNDSPTEQQIAATKKLLECGVSTGELRKRYLLLGGRQVGATASPGKNLYNEIQKWDHWVSEP